MSQLSHEKVLDALMVFRGKEAGQTARTIVQALLGADATAADERRLRMIVEELRMEGHPICAHPSSGYYIAASGEEIEEAIAFLHARAMTSLRQIARLRRVALPDLLGQMRLEVSDAC